MTEILRPDPLMEVLDRLPKWTVDRLAQNGQVGYYQKDLEAFWQEYNSHLWQLDWQQLYEQERYKRTKDLEARKYTLITLKEPLALRVTPSKMHVGSGYQTVGLEFRLEIRGGDGKFVNFHHFCHERELNSFVEAASLMNQLGIDDVFLQSSIERYLKAPQFVGETNLAQLPWVEPIPDQVEKMTIRGPEVPAFDDKRLLSVLEEPDNSERRSFIRIYSDQIASAVIDALVTEPISGVESFVIDRHSALNGPGLYSSFVNALDGAAGLSATGIAKVLPRLELIFAADLITEAEFDELSEMNAPQASYQTSTLSQKMREPRFLALYVKACIMAAQQATAVAAEGKPVLGLVKTVNVIDNLRDSVLSCSLDEFSHFWADNHELIAAHNSDFWKNITIFYTGNTQASSVAFRLQLLEANDLIEPEEIARIKAIQAGNMKGQALREYNFELIALLVKLQNERRCLSEQIGSPGESLCAKVTMTDRFAA